MSTSAYISTCKYIAPCFPWWGARITCILMHTTLSMATGKHKYSDYKYNGILSELEVVAMPFLMNTIEAQ